MPRTGQPSRSRPTVDAQKAPSRRRAPPRPDPCAAGAGSADRAGAPALLMRRSVLATGWRPGQLLSQGREPPPGSTADRVGVPVPWKWDAPQRADALTGPTGRRASRRLLPKSRVVSPVRLRLPVRCRREARVGELGDPGLAYVPAPLLPEGRLGQKRVAAGAGTAH